MKERNIITVDKQHVAIIDRVGVIMAHEITQMKIKWAKENGIGQWNGSLHPKGVGCVYVVPKVDGLPLWKNLGVK